MRFVLSDFRKEGRKNWSQVRIKCAMKQVGLKVVRSKIFAQEARGIMWVLESLRKTESFYVNSIAAVVWPWVAYQGLLALHHPDL